MGTQVGVGERRGKGGEWRGGASGTRWGPVAEQVGGKGRGRGARGGWKMRTLAQQRPRRRRRRQRPRPPTRRPASGPQRHQPTGAATGGRGGDAPDGGPAKTPWHQPGSQRTGRAGRGSHPVDDSDRARGRHGGGGVAVEPAGPRHRQGVAGRGRSVAGAWSAGHVTAQVAGRPTRSHVACAGVPALTPTAADGQDGRASQNKRAAARPSNNHDGRAGGWGWRRRQRQRRRLRAGVARVGVVAAPQPAALTSSPHTALVSQRPRGGRGGGGGGRRGWGGTLQCRVAKGNGGRARRRAPQPRP